MTYSYTQISQYLSCPRRYKHRYLDGWKEKDTRAAMLFGRAFEQAVGAYFQRQDAAAVLYREWSDSPGKRSSLFRAGQLGPYVAVGRAAARSFRPGRSGSHRPASSQFADQVQQAFGVERLRGLHGCHRRTRRHPLPPRVEDHCQPLSGGTCRIAGSGSSAGLLFLGHRYRRRGSGGICPQTIGRDSVLPDKHQRRTARGVRPPGSGLNPKNRSRGVLTSQWYPFPPEPLHQLSLYRTVPGAAGV